MEIENEDTEILSLQNFHIQLFYGIGINFWNTFYTSSGAKFIIILFQYNITIPNYHMITCLMHKISVIVKEHNLAVLSKSNTLPHP